MDRIKLLKEIKEWLEKSAEGFEEGYKRSCKTLGESPSEKAAGELAYYMGCRRAVRKQLSDVNQQLVHAEIKLSGRAARSDGIPA